MADEAHIGRPTKYTPTAVKKILRALRIGATRTKAAHAAGIHFDTFNEWRKAYSEFSAAVEKAEADGVIHWLEIIEKEANAKNWQAAAWKLERTNPKDYGRRQDIDVTSGGQPLKGYVAISPDDWDEQK